MGWGGEVYQERSRVNITAQSERAEDENLRIYNWLISKHVFKIIPSRFAHRLSGTFSAKIPNVQPVSRQAMVVCGEVSSKTRLAYCTCVVASRVVLDKLLFQKDILRNNKWIDHEDKRNKYNGKYTSFIYSSIL
jgi:hypothetical protein